MSGQFASGWRKRTERQVEERDTHTHTWQGSVANVAHVTWLLSHTQVHVLSLTQTEWQLTRARDRERQRDRAAHNSVYPRVARAQLKTQQPQNGSMDRIQDPGASAVSFYRELATSNVQVTSFALSFHSVFSLPVCEFRLAWPLPWQEDKRKRVKSNSVYKREREMLGRKMTPSVRVKWLLLTKWMEPCVNLVTSLVFPSFLFPLYFLSGLCYFFLSDLGWSFDSASVPFISLPRVLCMCLWFRGKEKTTQEKNKERKRERERTSYRRGEQFFNQ